MSPKLDYFRALGLSPSMALERASLDRAFRETSKRVHPDRFSREAPVQRKLALAHTELVNQAYKVLKDPRTRGEYLLMLSGQEVASETDRTEDPEFLMAMLEKQEALENASDDDTVAAFRAETEARYQHLIGTLEAWFDEGEGSLEAAKRALVELRYLRRMLEQIALKEEELF
ncbi:MAG: Fe-S protein assembly co-chaperone HscB [Myxococcota bacterium]